MANNDSPWAAGSWGNEIARVHREMSIEEAVDRSSHDELQQLYLYLTTWSDAIASEQAKRSVRT